ncbi:hypothetical protein G5V65_08980 [Rhodobacter sp. HX-7-19]|uniref:Uncharacterized protein n=1 Tax=Paragemmobacter kunshanensis TaxID=2583234 RepID=A0A6M1TSP9_9RHOB|nr:DUF5677 domain-containing protein [Rhodobacter kunshanensis]NGQ91030.1 hypothetical protein [Rhodobacter kunshanensis]
MILESANPPKLSPLTKDQYRAITSQIVHGITVGSAIEKLLDPVSAHSISASILARSVFESLLNAAYLTVAEASVARRVNLHKVYKDYREQVQVGKMGDLLIRIERRSKINKQHPILASAIEEFDPAGSGKPKAMLGHDRHRKIAFIHANSKNAGLCFFCAEKMVYGLASDLAHAEQAAIDSVEQDYGDLCFTLLSASMLSIRGIGICLAGLTLAPDLTHLETACDLFFRAAVPEHFQSQE